MAGAFSSAFSSAFDRGTIDALAYDSIWITAPELLIPWRKPIVPVKIDINHPMARGIEYANIFTHGGVDLAALLSPIIVDQGIGIGDRGSQLELTGSVGDYFNTTYDRTWSVGNSLSIFCIFKSTDNQGTFAGQRDGATTAWQLYSLTSSIGWNPGTEPFVSILDYPGGTPFDNNWHSIGSSALFGTGVIGYADGNVSVDGFNSITTAPSSANVPMSIGNRWQSFPTTGYEMSGQMLCFYMWRDRFLTGEDHKSLYDDPFQFLIPAI